jgi:endonuclease/exonuclease/phosphatase (EEP) superfamily protein YafD
MPRWILTRLIVLERVYFACLLAWAVMHVLFGDRNFLVFMLDSFAIYLFLPVLLVPLLATLTRQRASWVAGGLTLAVAGYLWGGLFLPRAASAPQDAPTLTVMTYNALGYTPAAGAVVAAIRASEADVVALQELNPAVAAAIERELADRYPYQVLDPHPTVFGMGTISRYPLQPSGSTLPGAWLGTPHVLALDFDGTPVTVVNFHAHSGIHTVAERERQAHTLADFAASHPHPLVVVGDLNATDVSVPYRIITTPLQDAWRTAGWGLGHTFPGADRATSPGSSRPDFAGVSVPMWLVRIDYVFYSPRWQARAARIGPWDGVSDHRPVVAELALVR